MPMSAKRVLLLLSLVLSVHASAQHDPGRDAVRLLAKGELTSKLDITVTGASKGAVEAVEKAGGKITLA